MTEARSCPVSNNTSPSRCSTTYALIGRGAVQLRDVASHTYRFLSVGPTCSGRIRTVPVLSALTLLMSMTNTLHDTHVVSSNILVILHHRVDDVADEDGHGVSCRRVAVGSCPRQGPWST